MTKSATAALTQASVATDRSRRYQEAAPMPITPFLNGERFDLETQRVLSVALEMISIALRTGDCDDDVKRAIATKLIALAKAGERNPDTLCEEVLKDIGTPQQWAASEAARSSAWEGQKARN
jgi:hypothetical protein